MWAAFWENRMTAEHANHDIDALLPAEIAELAEGVGVKKAQLDVVSLVALAVLPGRDRGSMA